MPRILNSDSAGPSAVNVHFNTARKTSVLLATARVRLQGPDGQIMTCRALIDQGSEATFVSQYDGQQLRLSRTKEHLSVSGLGGGNDTIIKGSTCFKVMSQYQDHHTLTIQAFVLKRITTYCPHANLELSREELRSLTLADPFLERPERIEVLLGADVFGELIRGGLKCFSQSGLIAQNTIFGWVLSGSVPSRPDKSITVHHSLCEHIDSQLQAFWEIESVPQNTSLSDDDMRCERYFQDTTYRTDEGRFVVRLPFKHDATILGNSKPRALATFFSTCRQNARNEPLCSLYTDFMHEYETLGHMTRVPSSNDPSQFRVFLPHHGVFREDKLTTKLRVVFNASSATESGFSLNDTLHTGPKLQSDIIGIILNWRFRRYVLTADIEKMFRQIIVDERDRKYQCILWHDTDSAKPHCFELNTVTYGTAPAPYLAMRVIKELAESCDPDHSHARSALTNNIYVDDVLLGCNDKATLISMRDQVNSVLRSGGFILKKWTSNSPDILRDFAPQLLRDIDSNQSFKLLGLTWNSRNDAFELCSPNIERSSTSKRAILSHIARFYDPLGWCSPLIVRAKCLLQSLWLQKIGWDEQLPNHVIHQWREFVDDVRVLNRHSIPRWCGYDPRTNTVELVGFSDASATAYSAVVYLRLKDVSNTKRSTLLIAKSKVAPLKVLSIPRLELCGALLLCNLLKYVRSLLSLPIFATHCYTDSKIVLAWLQKPPHTWITFVANRIAIIQNELPDAKWHHVRSHDNPADLNSRGISANEFINSNLWWFGPSWINSDDDPNLIDKIISPTNIDRKSKRIHNHLTTSAPWNVINKFSSWAKLVRVVAFVLRFIKRVRRTTNVTTSVYALTTTEINESIYVIMKEIQRVRFPTEHRALSDNLSISNQSKLYSLRPYLDEKGIIRVGGRLRRSDLPYEMKHPIILMADSNSEMLINHYHVITLHGGLKLTLNAIRERFWIINARNKVKTIIRECVRCERYRAETSTQLMSDLPRARCVQSRPFTHTGVDYAGPLTLRSSPRTKN